MKKINVNGVMCTLSGFNIHSVDVSDSKLNFIIIKNIPSSWTDFDTIQKILENFDLRIADVKFNDEHFFDSFSIKFENGTDIDKIKTVFSEKYPDTVGYFSSPQMCNIFKIEYSTKNEQILDIIKDKGNIISTTIDLEKDKYCIYFAFNNTSMTEIDTVFADIYSSDHKRKNVKISLHIDTSLIPEQGMFDYLAFQTVEEYIQTIFKNKVTAEYEDKIVFKSKSIGLQLQARSAINKISEPSIIKCDSDFIECLLGDELYDDHFNSPMLDSLHNQLGKIVIKKSTRQIFIYGTPAVRDNICRYVTKYLNQPTNKIYTYKIPIVSHSKTIGSYIKNIEPLINCHDCVCATDENYVTVKKVGGTVEYVANMIQQVVSNVVTNTLDDDIDGNTEKCVLCFNKVVEKAELESCGCVYCKECFRQLLFSQQTKCVSCCNDIQLSDLKFVNDLEISRIFTPILEKFLLDNKQYVRCLTPECSGIYTNTGGKNIYCTVCSHVYCLKCQNDYYNPIVSHDYLSCDKYKKYIKIDTKSKKWLTKNTRKCPGCQAIIQRTEGCLHMTCRQCKYEFCWDCLEKWSNVKHGLYECTEKQKHKDAELDDHDNIKTEEDEENKQEESENDDEENEESKQNEDEEEDETDDNDEQGEDDGDDQSEELETDENDRFNQIFREVMTDAINIRLRNALGIPPIGQEGDNDFFRMTNFILRYSGRDDNNDNNDANDDDNNDDNDDDNNDDNDDDNDDDNKMEYNDDDNKMEYVD